MVNIQNVRTEFECKAKELDSLACVVFCRKTLWDVLRCFFVEKSWSFAESATVLELLSEQKFAQFIGDSAVMKSLDFIRILGVNAEHGEAPSAKQAKLAQLHIRHFLDFIEARLAEKVPPASADAFSEAKTRKVYIDLYLNEAGWEVLATDGMMLPGKAGIEIEEQGMPNSQEKGFCDYVLYGDNGKPLAVVEAKKTSVEPGVGRHQVVLYGDCLKAQYGYVPVLYYTNGYEAWCIDGIYPDRKVAAFHTKAELAWMIQKRSHAQLSDLRIKDEITNRAYQKTAITKLCERFNNGIRRGLLVMATGTGKTRVAISLVDVLTRHSWIRNVLFLADRTSLVKQAKTNFEKLLPEMTYCALSEHGDKKDKNLNARVMFSTYQTMIHYVDAEEKLFSTGRFDLIVIDEAHRSIFNKYSAIFTYFDSLLIGLTATPKSEVDANTYRIFGCESGVPDFDYSLQEAVKDGFLCPYKVVNRTTKILRDGIKYADLSSEDKAQIEAAFSDEPPTPDFEIPQNKLFREVYNETTCDRVLQDVMKMGQKVESGELLGKTIIFAWNHKHAEMIVERFRVLYPQYGASYCQLIDNTVKYADDLILKFEEKRDFRIAVSVDMLDTGIDVPAVLNLVFFKPVKSYIKFIQMIGRGTRLCPDVFAVGEDKKDFLIFDYCGNFEYFGDNTGSTTPAESLSISQRLFNLRLDLLVELQDVKHQEIPFHQKYHAELAKLLHGEAVKIKSHASRMDVREEMAYVDKYQSAEKWNGISPLEQVEIKMHLTRLVDAELDEVELAKAFDARMFHIELGLLQNGDVKKVTNHVSLVRKICEYLLSLSTIPKITAKTEQLRKLHSEQFWESPTVAELESLRRDLRELMQFLDDGTKRTAVILHVEDETTAGPEVDGPLVDIRSYRQKVIDWLAEHSDKPVVHKIRNLEKISDEDMQELEDVLWKELGTREEYESTDGHKENLAVFVRSLTGLEQNAVNEKFGQFLNDNVLNSSQQEFVKAIIDYVRVNGEISSDEITNVSPFNGYDIVQLFGDKLPVVKTIINIFWESVKGAA